MAAGKFAYRNRRKFKKAYNFVSRKRKAKSSFKRRQRSRIGEPVGSGTSKQRWFQSDALVNESLVLHTIRLTDCDKGDNINQRTRNLINCRGFKVCMEMRNRSKNRMYCNIAVLSPKVDQTIETTDFFKGTGTTRGNTFSDARSSIELHCSAINTDRYNILKHKRFTFAPNPNEADVYNPNQGSTSRNINMYIPLKRQLRFEGTGAQPVDGQVYLVYWFDKFLRKAGDVAGTADDVTVQATNRMYFHDSKNCC
jgi:hypothetical protein